MFFTLSKILVVFIYPITWIFILLVWRVFSRKPVIKKRLDIITLLLFLFFTNDFIFNKLANAWQPKPVQIALSRTFSAAIILGGYESYDKYGNGTFNQAADRFIQAFKFYRQNTVQKIVISGARVVDGKPVPSDFLREQLLRVGVKAEDIIIDDQSKNTFENALFSKRLLDSAKLTPPYLLLTSAMHMPRAEKVFKRAGVTTVSYPCDYQVLQKNFDFGDYFLPKSEVLNQWSIFLKEVAGTVVYTLFKKA